MDLSDTEKQYVRNALNGDFDGLFYAFEWCESPQGHNFWEAQYYADKLTPEGRTALEAMLND
jgi:hypothetical protein